MVVMRICVSIRTGRVSALQQPGSPAWPQQVWRWMIRRQRLRVSLYS